MIRTEDIIAATADRRRVYADRRRFDEWTAAEIAFVQAKWSDGLKLREISARIEIVSGFRRSASSIGGKVRRMGLKGRCIQTRTDKGCSHGNPRIGRTEPSTEAWIDAATIAAKEAGLRLRDVVGPAKRRILGPVRWKAWRAVLDANPHASIAGLARVTGFNHTSIIHGLNRLREGCG